ncbi:hypothetical protein HYX13_04400 [Candidatus Woesearchaeota archaeon]|nr:hypothetical protein [Candidatus Woesearchaeota archaeon]
MTDTSKQWATRIGVILLVVVLALVLLRLVPLVGKVVGDAHGKLIKEKSLHHSYGGVTTI